MAQFSISFKSNNNVLDVVNVIGSKMSNSWQKKTYGKYYDPSETFYYVSKPNKYEIKWITAKISKYNEVHYSFASTGKGKKIPGNNVIIKLA